MKPWNISTIINLFNFTLAFIYLYENKFDITENKIRSIKIYTKIYKRYNYDGERKGKAC